MNDTGAAAMVAGDPVVLAGVDPEDLAERYGTPLYVYDLDVVDRQGTALRSILPASFEVAYAVKANPALAVVAHLGSIGLGIDVASGGARATALGFAGLVAVVAFLAAGPSLDRPGGPAAGRSRGGAGLGAPGWPGSLRTRPDQRRRHEPVRGRALSHPETRRSRSASPRRPLIVTRPRRPQSRCATARHHQCLTGGAYGPRMCCRGG